MAALASAVGMTGLLAAVTAVYLAYDGLGAALLAIFLACAIAVAASGWVFHWHAAGEARAAALQTTAENPAGGDSPELRLIEGAAGEIKNALAAIRGFSEILAAGPQDGPEFQQSCRFLVENSEQLSAFVAQLHDYARFERGRLRLLEQQVDAAELVEAALILCREAVAAGPEAVIVAHLAEGVELRCDAARIRHAVASLVHWVVQATSGEGAAMVDVTTQALPGGGLAITASSPAPTAIDVGPRLFEPHLAQNGLNGLALPIARRVALLHSGDVTVATDAGTRAILMLPGERVSWPEAQEEQATLAA